MHVLGRIDIGKYILHPDGTVYSKRIKRPLKPMVNPVTGYAQVCINGTRILHHRLIAMHFIDNPKNLPQVNHKNRIKTDNRFDNLEWCTGSYNTIDAYKSGLAKGPRGSINGNAKLTESMVMKIRDMALTNSHSHIARHLKISQPTVTRIVNKKTWTHV